MCLAMFSSCTCSLSAGISINTRASDSERATDAFIIGLMCVVACCNAPKAAFDNTTCVFSRFAASRSLHVPTQVHVRVGALLAKSRYKTSVVN